MSETITAAITSSISSVVTNTDSTGIIYRGQPAVAFTQQWIAGQVTKVWNNTYPGTSATSTSAVIDVTALTDVFGNVLNYAQVAHLFLQNNSSANLTYGGGTSALLAAMPVLVGQTGGSCINLTTNLAVSPSAKRLLLLNTSAAPLNATVFIAGA